MAADLDVIVGELSELCIVETHLLLVGGDAQAETGDEVHDEEDDAGDDEGPGEARTAVGDLVAQLDVVVVEPATGDLGAAVQGGNIVAGEQSSQAASGC